MASGIEFDLFAPRNKEAALIGSFSQWQEIPMEKGEDGYFRTQVELEDDVYQYKFRVETKSPNFEPDQWVDVIDPYATDVDETRTVGIVRIKDGNRIVDDYIWQHDDTQLPENQELVIYEMHVADFTGGEVDSHKHRKYLDAIEKLKTKITIYLSITRNSLPSVHIIAPCKVTTSSFSPKMQMPKTRLIASLAYVGWHDQGDRVIVVANFSDQNLSGYNVETRHVASLQETSLQNWRDLFTKTEVAGAADGLVIDLPQYSALVFVSEAAS